MDVEKLALSLSGERACGRNLEDTQLLLSFDAYRIFGYDLVDSWIETDWSAIKVHALEGLQQSKDLRLLAYLAAAVLRTDGLHAYVEVLSVAAGWLCSYWDDLYPLVDEDAIARRSALMCLTGNHVIVDGIRRAPMITHKQLGPISLRDIEIAEGLIARPEYQPIGPNEESIRMIAQDSDELGDLSADLQRGIDSLTSIHDSMASKANLGEATLDCERLERMFRHMMHKVSLWQLRSNLSR